MTIAIAGPTTFGETVGLIAGANGCASSLAGTFCTLTVPGLSACPTTGNCYTATIATYDGIAGCPSACAIPGTAHELSGNQNVPFTIATAQANQLNLTLDGVPASVALVSFDPALGGSGSAGLTLSKCFASTVKVEAVAADADGNIILGPGAPVPSLSSNDTAHLSVAPPSVSAPNTFALSRPAIPSANHVVQLTTTMTPLPGIGGASVTLHTNLTFSSDVCGVVTEFHPSFPGNETFIGMAAGADGNLWFVDCSGSRIGRITTAGVATAFITGITAASGLRDITAGPDGNLWFTEFGVDKIGRITTNGVVTEFSTGITAGGGPYNIATGADKNLWFTELEGNRVGRITTSGVVTEFVSGITASSGPFDITGAADGNLWFTECAGNRIARITTSGGVTEFPTGVAGAFPTGIVGGPGGNIWYADESGGVGRVSIEGAIAEFSVGAGASSNPYRIAAGPDGNVWFTEFGIDQIGRVTPDGTIAQYSGLTAGSQPNGIATGADGSIWFTEQSNNAIGRMQ
jgi:streptogramin lyase